MRKSVKTNKVAAQTEPGYFKHGLFPNLEMFKISNLENTLTIFEYGEFLHQSNLTGKGQN